MCGMLTSLGVMTWIVVGTQIAIYNNELKFVEKDISVIGCPANITTTDYANFTGYVKNQ